MYQRAYRTDMYEGMLGETVTMPGDGGTRINAYLARPLGPGPFPAVVLLHHMPGWDDWCREATRRFAHHSYVALSPEFVLQGRARHTGGCRRQGPRRRRHSG
jgi:dienelactone hydrolase